MESLSKQLEAIENMHGLSKAARDRLEEIEASENKSGSMEGSDDDEEEDEEEEGEIKNSDLIVSSTVLSLSYISFVV
jgi:hypothetical protein